MKELQELINRKNYSSVLDASLRYSATAGQLTELIIISSDNSQAAVTINIFTRHKKVLQDIYDLNPDLDTERKYILDNKNYLNLYTQQLNDL